MDALVYRDKHGIDRWRPRPRSTRRRSISAWRSSPMQTRPNPRMRRPRSTGFPGSALPVVPAGRRCHLPESPPRHVRRRQRPAARAHLPAPDRHDEGRLRRARRHERPAGAVVGWPERPSDRSAAPGHVRLRLPVREVQHELRAVSADAEGKLRRHHRPRPATPTGIHGRQHGADPNDKRDINFLDVILAILAFALWLAELTIWLVTILPALLNDLLTWPTRELIYELLVLPAWSLYMASRTPLVMEGFLMPKPEEISMGLTTARPERFWPGPPAPSRLSTIQRASRRCSRWVSQAGSMPNEVRRPRYLAWIPPIPGACSPTSFHRSRHGAVVVRYDGQRVRGALALSGRQHGRSQERLGGPADACRSIPPGRRRASPDG